MKTAQTLLAPNPVLFGRDETRGILCVEPSGDSHVRIYRRSGAAVTSEQQALRPFLWLPEMVMLQGFDRKVEYEELTGNGQLKFLARFQSWTDFQRARAFLSRAQSPFYSINDPGQQFLLATGKTSFKGMRFEQLHRLQLAVATNDDASLRLVQLSDNRAWQQELTGSETQILKRLVQTVRERDPDVLEGHDIFRFALEKLSARARAGHVPLKLGRDESVPQVRQSRVQIAERTIQYPKYEIHGRHIVDTFLLTHFYDVATRELENFDLDEVAEHFGLTEDAATEPALVVRKISDLLSSSYFIQAQIFPYNYQDVVVRGNATKIDALFLREYLHQRHSVPALEEPRPFEGGYTDVFEEGIVQNVWHCDAQSLYPSLLLANTIKPRKDELNLFLPLLRDLREFRLKAKAAARQARSDTDRQHHEALQQTFKTLINSFYGYLGFSQAHFGDFDAAEEVARRGRETLKTMLDWLRHHGAHVIEIDTDGLYFVPPPRTDPEKLAGELQEALPKGVDVEIDGQYPAMFSYKMKNYALLDQSGRLHIRGSALRSRGLEKFQRQFLDQALTLALKGEPSKVPHLYEDYCEKIEQRKFPIELLAKTETLQETLDVYRQKIAQSARNRSAVYELALKSGRNYQPGDRISYYVTGDGKRVSVYENCKLVSEFDPARRDENVEYYLDKLKSLYKKFAPLLTKTGGN
jgi:DNA polymerase I